MKASFSKPGFTHTHRSQKLQQHEHFSSYFLSHIGASLSSVKENLRPARNSLSTSVKTCTSRNPSGLCGHWAHSWAHVGVSLFPANTCQCVKTCAKGTLRTFINAFYGFHRPDHVFSLEMYPGNLHLYPDDEEEITKAVTTHKKIKPMNDNKAVF